MVRFLIVLMYVLCLPQVVFSRSESLTDSVSPVHVLSSDQLQNTPLNERSIDQIINAAPSDHSSLFSQQDVSLGSLNLRKNLVLLNGRRTTEDISQIPKESIDRIEVLKDGASSIYGSEATSSVVNIITRKTFELHPQELPDPSKFDEQEIKWKSKGIGIGRIGLNEVGGQYTYGFSLYDKNAWSWQPGMGLGETYGLGGPVVALGKTPQGPALSIFDQHGVFVGDFGKKELNSDMGIASRYLVKAEYPKVFDETLTLKRLFTSQAFDPFSVSVLPKGQPIGDTIRYGDLLGYNLKNFKGFGEFFDDEDVSSCVPPYANEPIFARNVLNIEPNDPLYKKGSKKKKSGILGGVIGGLVSVGSGVLGSSTGVSVDKEGPAVYDQYSLPQIGFMPLSDPQSAWNHVDAQTKNILVAVIDSGLDLAHPDGPAYIWTNENEIPDNKIDDDKNGYVDDVHGWNFYDENNDLTDLRGHGTFVAGIIAAKSNNGLGMAGINPGAVIMPIKVTDKHGNTNNLNIFRAIHYAVAHKARVINVSLGAKGFSKLERLAVNYARAKGVVVVMASGNDGIDMEDFGPSSVGGGLAVGSLNVDGSRSTVSNWGGNNALMAPGEEIYSLHSKDARWEGPSGSKERLYTKLSGTSFSAPMVAAVASLLLVKDPQLTPDRVEDILQSTARRLGDNDWDYRTGAGLLDASKALQQIAGENFNVKITGLNRSFNTKTKKLQYVDVFATVRGDVAYFTVELAKGRHSNSFRPLIGFSKQQAHDDLVARINTNKLNGSNEWQVLIKAVDKSNVEHKALILLTI